MAKMASSRVISKEEEKKRDAAAEASKARLKKGKGLRAWFSYKLLIGVGIGFMLVSEVIVMMANSGNKGGRGGGGVSSGGGTSKPSAQVNEKSFIKGVNSAADDNFTAAASPFFDGWSYDHVAWGLDGIGLYGEKMLGMSGALQPCEKDEGLEGGVMPTNFDVREAYPGCVGAVYDSGNCSSSYAVAAVSSLSSRFCVADSSKYANLQLSSQQVLSCDKASRGCNGGGADGVWQYIQKRGLYPEECLPYAGAKKAACKTECDASKKLKAINHCMMSGEKALKREIYNRGPVVAPIYVKDDFLVYSGGVYTPTDNAKQQIGADGQPIFLAASVIGWGKADGTKYWLIQGSWGTKWGEEGFARVAVDTALREGYALVGYPATEEAIAEKARKEEEAAKRLEEAKKERAAREERIREAKMKREEEARAAKEDADLTELDADEDFEEEIAAAAVDDTEM